MFKVLEVSILLYKIFLCSRFIPRPAGPHWLDLQEDSLSPAARQTEDSQNPGGGGGGGQSPAAVSPQESHIKSLHSLNKGEFLEH